MHVRYKCLVSSVLVFLTAGLSACAHHIEDKALPANFQEAAKGKRVAVIWLMPKYLSTAGFYYPLVVGGSGEKLKARAVTPAAGPSAVTVVRGTYFTSHDQVNVHISRLALLSPLLADLKTTTYSPSETSPNSSALDVNTKSVKDDQLKQSGKDYIRTFVHTITTASMKERWHQNTLPDALKQYGLQIATLKDYDTEDLRSRNLFGQLDEHYFGDLTYQFNGLPESDYLFVIEMIATGVGGVSTEEPSRWTGPDLKSVTLAGESAIYGSLRDAKSPQKVLWEHLAIAEEPLRGQNQEPLYLYPREDGSIQPRISNEAIQTAVETSFENAMKETYASFFNKL